MRHLNVIPYPSITDQNIIDIRTPNNIFSSRKQ